MAPEILQHYQSQMYNPYGIQDNLNTAVESMEHGVIHLERIVHGNIMVLNSEAGYVQIVIMQATIVDDMETGEALALLITVR